MYSKKTKRFKRVYIEITNICNMSCSFCPKTIRKKEYMKIDDFEKIIIKIKDYTDHVYLHVKGEPLMHREIVDILKICNKYEMNVNITTNGTLLFENKEKLFDDVNVRQINVSLHSIENINNEEDIILANKTIEAAKYISENSNTIIAFRLWNIENKTEGLDDSNKIVIEEIQKKFGIFDIYEKLKLNNNVMVKDKVFLNIDYRFEWPDMNKEEKNIAGKCRGLVDQIGILVDGTVVPCCLDNNGDINLGNILDDNISFEDIFNSDRSNSILEGFKRNKFHEELCRKCGYVKREKIV